MAANSNKKTLTLVIIGLLIVALGLGYVMMQKKDKADISIDAPGGKIEVEVD
ncbi:MAG: hypothetical protein HKN36_04825 [Hellea sp.]|nr:hypothetical protein [Hellea sp.]